MRLLILLAVAVAFASGGLLQGDITTDLTPPGSFATEYHAASSSSASSSSGISTSSSDGWVGIPTQIQQQQPQVQNAHYQQAAPVYLGSALTTGANYQQAAASPAITNPLPATSTGHKYTTVSFGNGLVGLGHSVDYSAITQQSHTGAFGQGLGGYSNSFGSLQNSNFNKNTVSYSRKTQAVPIEVPQPYKVTVARPVATPVAVPKPVAVPRPVPIEVLQPYAVPVERPYPVEVTRHVPVPVVKPVYVKVPQPVAVPVPKPYPVVIKKPVPVKIPTKIEVPVPYPVKVEHHHVKDHHHHHHQDYHHAYDHSHHDGSGHHSSPLLHGLSGGLSSKLHGGHGSDHFHHYRGSYGVPRHVESDYKFADGLSSKHFGFASSHSLGHDYKLGHEFNADAGYAGKYLNSAYSKFPDSYSSSFSKEIHPSKFSDYSTIKYSSYPGFASSSSNTKGSFATSYKSAHVPETISQHYDSHGGYKY